MHTARSSSRREEALTLFRTPHWNEPRYLGCYDLVPFAVLEVQFFQHFFTSSLDLDAEVFKDQRCHAATFKERPQENMFGADIGCLSISRSRRRGLFPRAFLNSRN
jgi:hypothetical protein